MKVAVVGGGFTGLTAAYELAKHGNRVTVFERDDHLGGLAWGFKQKNWDWHIEAAYHHLFTNDRAIIGLMRQLGLSDALLYRRPVTANLYHDSHYQFDSPAHLFAFPYLSLADKIRTGALAAFCKVYPFWTTLEGTTAKDFFRTWGGKRAWEIIWEPLMTGKFGHFDNTIAASWLWARVHKRTSSLVYIKGGFQTAVAALAHEITGRGGTIFTSTPVTGITASGPGYRITWGKTSGNFDRILLTIPTPFASGLLSRFPQVSEDWSDALTIPHLHAQVLILETEKPVLDRVYWLSITDRSFPFLAVVAHTNFMDKKHYGGKHLTYIGNYLPQGHPYLALSKEKLLSAFMPYIRRLSGGRVRVTDSFLFTGPFAQPVHQLHYSRRAPRMRTSLPGVYLANMDSIYPWDRGTNYAVELGQKAAGVIMEMP